MRIFDRAFRLIIVATMLVVGLLAAVPTASAQTSDPQYFAETGFRVGNPAFWDYFNKRGGIRNFGFPVSRTFTLFGKTTQFFQRRIIQLNGDGSVSQLNLLDPEVMPYNNINLSQFPAADPALVAAAPAITDPDYATEVLDFVQENAPESFQGLDVEFWSEFESTVSMGEAFPNGGGNAGLLATINLEMWGVPTSKPALDPRNHNFAYLRLQRGIMHFDLTTGQTQGLLLADYLKAIITGQNLPADLAEAAAGSRYFMQYNNAAANGLNRPDQLPGSDLKDAFEKEQPVSGPAPVTSGFRYGFQAHMYYQDRQRIMDATKGAGFGWLKQQVRWADVEETKGQPAWGELDAMADSAAGNGVGLLFSVVTSPRWSRADGSVDGPPSNLNDFGDFMAALATRYKGRVQAYEIWNEQNLAREWAGGQINAGAYVEMLKVAYTRIKAVDPNAIVISGALTPTGVNDVNIAVDDKLYLQQMYEYQGGIFKQYADAVGVHTAGFNNAPEDWVDRNTTNTPGFKGHGSFYFRRIDDLHSVSQAYGDSRQYWVTEFHWASAAAPVPAGYEWTTHLDEPTVAKYMADAIQTFRTTRTYVGAVFVWNLNFRTFADYHTNETAIFGVLNEDWSPRLIYIALRDMPK